MDELYPLPTGRAAPMTPEQALERLSAAPPAAGQHHTERYFGSDAERDAWRASHALPALQTPDVRPGDTLRVYIGVDAGSTTSKLVLLDENETVLDRFYASNRGDPIEVIRHGLQELYKKYSAMGVKLEVLGFGTTGYGEVMLSKAFGGDYHTVETVAHAAAACHYLPDVTFLLDIGGQDMKAIWIQDGVVTNMLLNEACSSGCGSFLEEFAASLGPRRAGQPLHRLYEQQHHHRAEKRPHPRRHHGGAVPLHHQKRLYQGGAHPQHRCAGQPDRGAGRHL